MATQDSGLIENYVQKIQALAVKTQDGHDVTALVKETIENALKHFEVWAPNPASASTESFKGRLRFFANMEHVGQPKYKETMAYALSLVP